MRAFPASAVPLLSLLFLFHHDCNISDGPLTMTLSPRDIHILQLLTVFILVTLTFYWLFLEDRFDVHDVYHVTVSGKKGAFIEDVLATEIYGSFDGSALAELCSTKTWIPGLIFKCEAPRGGVANVRNVFLNCVRYAIEAGATGFIVPEIMVRRPKLQSLNELHAQRTVPFSYLFDQPYFKETLSAACPQIHVYDHQNDLWDKPSTAKPVLLSHPQLSSSFLKQAESVMVNPANWTYAFQDHLNKTHPNKFSDSMPVVVSLHNPLLQWPIHYEAPAFIASFGRIIRSNEDLRRLAGTVLYAMNKKYQLTLGSSVPGIKEGNFYGAHLRTAIDAEKAEWTPYATQSKNYLSHAAGTDHHLIYASFDSRPDVLKFIDQAANYSFPIQVITKDLLLEGKGFEHESAQLSTLTLDQQSVVDYEVMLRASQVGGTWESSFAWSLAMRRHVATGGGSWIGIEVFGRDPSVMPSEPISWSNTDSAASPGDVESAQVPNEPASPHRIESQESGSKAHPNNQAQDNSQVHDNNQAPNNNQAHPNNQAQPNHNGQATNNNNQAHDNSKPNANNQPHDNHQAPATNQPQNNNPAQDSSKAPSNIQAPDNKKPAANNQENPAEQKEAPEISANALKRQHSAAELGPQSFSDAYSTIFGDVVLGDTPGFVFRVAMWP